MQSIIIITQITTSNKYCMQLQRLLAIHMLCVIANQFPSLHGICS